REGGLEAAIRLAVELGAREGSGMAPRYHRLEGLGEEGIRAVIGVHRRYREYVRGEAGRLG
ncbi:MAG: hypothetical protein AABX40_01600, partial [Candidatus Hydrothermarchaeota archaeon]